MDFSVPADNKVKIKESKKRDKYLEIARELKKNLSNMVGDGHTNCGFEIQTDHLILARRPDRVIVNKK